MYLSPVDSPSLYDYSIDGLEKQYNFTCQGIYSRKLIIKLNCNIK